jgi:Na+/H+ antiporter NhaD/arsenite permease-like protein
VTLTVPTQSQVTAGWSVVPFIAYLLLMALLPLFLGRFWESNRNKLILALAAGAPVVIYLMSSRPGGPQMLLQTGFDYVSFMALLGALFTISGGICLRGSLPATTFVNTALLAMGSVLGSLVGTTGASALLIRPLLRANQHRPHATHLVVFFIFVVSNAAGLLTPLGDPPLFLGFLRGVPFTWTLRFLPVWALVNGSLLILFALVDSFALARERRSRRPLEARLPPSDGERLTLDGRLNLVWILGIVAVVFAMGTLGTSLIPNSHVRSVVQAVSMLALAALSWKTTSPDIHRANRFTWAPIIEVAVVFVGVFVTMVPALCYLEERGASLGITDPWQFFWAAGALSSVLDNAPTYLTFASLATGVVDQGRGVLSVEDLGRLAAHPVGQHLLSAISCGAVLMGALTYIGNGPNFMVKAIAEQHHMRTPSFFKYTLWSFTILIPLFILVSRLFFSK